MQSSGNCETPTLRTFIGFRVRPGNSLSHLKDEFAELA